MIVGYDITRVKNGKRYSICTTYDINFSKFFTEFEFHEGETRNLPVNPIVNLLRRCIDYFSHANNGFLPENIIIYRNGVSDKEKKMIYDSEIKPLNCLLSGESVAGAGEDNNNIIAPYKIDYKAKLCFIVVNKRTEMKFFEKINDRINNPKEGTVVDTQLTTPGDFEFYLQAQFVNMGTATPTHYHCLFDSTGVPLEILEEVTYRLCYYYWNWPGPIRVPAMLKNAEVNGKFGAKNLHNENVRDRIKDKLYYI